jgi:hypothetical protein
MKTQPVHRNARVTGTVAVLLTLVLLAAAGGLAVGLHASSAEPAGRDAGLALAGTALGGVLLLSYAGGLAARPRRDWHRLGVRIAGSRTAASAGIVLAFAVTGAPVTGQG